MTTVLEPQTVVQHQIEPIPHKKGKFLWWEFETEIKWGNVFLITLLHAICFYGLWTLDYTNLLMVSYLIVSYIISGSGVTLGAHRYWTHKSMKAKLPLRMILVFSYASAGQNTIKEWVKDHTVHHKYSDTIADPHDTHRGFFFSHIGWLMLKKRPEVLKIGKQFDYSYLYEDPLVAFHDRNFWWLKPLCCYVIPTIIPVYLWNEPLTNALLLSIVRQVLVAHGTLSLNSFCHFFGTKPFDKNITPTNNTFVDVITIGEGTHNFHHTFPWDYRVHPGTKGDSGFNLTTIMVHCYQKLGWAYDLKKATKEMIEKEALKHGDGSYFSWNGHVCEEPKEKGI